jgi:cobaltochelatase CobS
METNLSNKTVGELRGLAIFKAKQANLSSSWIQLASKEQLIQFIETGSLPNNSAFVNSSPSSNNTGNDKLKEALLEVIGKQSIDENRIREIVQSEIEKLPKPANQLIDVKINGELKIEGLERQHYLFPLVLNCVASRVNIMLVGPAGSGKTTLCFNIAKELGLDFDLIPVGPMTSKGDLLGMRNANGEYVETGFVKIYRNGGVFLIDEIDAGHAGVLTILNAALANGHLSTPGGLVKKHKDCIIIAGANTFGTGANRQYVGRNQLDAATLDRFAFIEVPYDEGFESFLCGDNSAVSPSINILEGGKVNPIDWNAIVQAARAECTRHNIRHIISPRASFMGRDLCHNIGKAWLVRMLITKGLDADSIAKLNIL